jgi:hypothetical protein
MSHKSQLTTKKSNKLHPLHVPHITIISIMASSPGNEVVVRTAFDYDTDNSNDKSAEYAPEQVVASPDESNESNEPVAKKQKKISKKEHYTIIRQKEQADLDKLVDKIVRMKDRVQEKKRYTNS